MTGQDLTLGALSAALQESVTDPSDALREFVVAYPVARLDLTVLSRELSEIQMVARLLSHNAESLEDGTVTLPDKLSGSLRKVVEGAGHMVEEMDEALDGDGETAERGNAWLEHTAERLLPMGRLAENSRIAMNLGLDLLLFAINFQPSSGENDLPAYSDSQILREAQNLRGRLMEDAENDDFRVQAQLNVLVEFIDALQEYMEQTSADHSLSTAVPGTTVSSLHSEAIPDYHAIGITNPTPLFISLKHLAKKELSNHEVVEVAFLTRNNQPTIAVSTMDPPTRFYDTQANQVSVLSNQHGVNMLFCQNGRTWAYLIEEEPKELNALNHDGVNFRKPSVYLGDYINGRRIQQMRWPGAKPFCFSRDGQWLAVGSARNRIALIDVKAGAVLYKATILACHADQVTHAVFTPDGNALVSQSRDGTIRLTSPATAKSIAKLDLDTWKKPSFLGVTPDNAIVVSIWGDTVYHWNYTTAALESYALSSRRTREGWPLAVSQDCRFLCCRTEDGADISDLYSGKVLYTIKFESGYVTAATFSPDGRYLILGKAAQWMGVRVTMSTLDVWELVF
ncbi:Quino protein amine dehydrogenase [Thelonectria olida]|uniref:Quino protein amine dehydrogenase n=1 Tax=Thelonectria olida TaxID=1576542 RepID=A0A9P9AN43_9HYPO|nr:Quino protein amine dehydrogenase [Thelonectria olida]